MNVMCHDVVLLQSKLDAFETKIKDAKFKGNNLTTSF